MSYLKSQVEKNVQPNEVMEYLVDFFDDNQNKRFQISEIVNSKFSFEEVDTEISKLVSRGLLNEFYVDDRHFFEYTTYVSCESDIIIEEILDRLKIKGYRITDSRKKLIKIFTDNPTSHFTFDELIKLSGTKVNVATMYNNIATLLDETIINEFHIDDTKLFELNNKSHAHFICTKCNVVYNVDTRNSEVLSDGVEEEYGFKVLTKRVEFTGICLNCKPVSKAENISIVNENEYPNLNEEEISQYFGYLQDKTNKNSKHISLVFLSEDEIYNLNKEFRNIERPTDVLTFVEDEDDYLGDILICYDFITKQADEYGHSFKRELYFLITHGYLHLIGYDHIEAGDEKEMFTLQTELLNKYGVSRDE